MPPRSSVVHDEGKSPYETEAEYRARTKKNWTRVPATEERLRNSRLRSPRPLAEGGVLTSANFEPKRVRKQRRKALVRAYLANKRADFSAARADRAEFFRNLRLVKVQRQKIAREMRVLALTLSALQREVAAVEDREPTVDLAVVDEAHDLVRSALKAANGAADEFFLFSRQRIYYFKETAA
jgi:hypothetical protein